MASLSRLVQCNSSLLGTFVSYEENEMLQIPSLGPYLQQPFFFVTYEWAQIVTLQKAGKAFEGKYSSLWGPFASNKVL
jgi:hypothetical protein